MLLDAKRGDIGSTARAYATAYLEPRPGPPPLADASRSARYRGGLDRAVPADLSALRSGHLPPRADVELGRRRPSGPDPLGRQAALAPRRRARPRVGSRPGRRARDVERRRRRRRDVSAGSRRGPACDAAGHPPPAGRRSTGSDAGRRGSRVHQVVRRAGLVAASRSVIYAFRRPTPRTGAQRPEARRPGSQPRSGKPPAGEAGDVAAAAEGGPGLARIRKERIRATAERCRAVRYPPRRVHRLILWLASLAVASSPGSAWPPAHHPASRPGRTTRSRRTTAPCSPRGMRHPPPGREHHQADDGARRSRACTPGRGRHRPTRGHRDRRVNALPPPGERVTVRDLAVGALVPSANDAATALALHVGQGSVAASSRS